MYHTEMPNIGKKYKNVKVVTIGGGTGNAVILKGLKLFTNRITSIVTVADDGGGSGILRSDLGMLPPGDIRACLIALANTEPAMEKLMKYRFMEGNLKGQSFGNLLLAAMSDIYGGFYEGLKETSNVLAITGKVIPMTLEDVTLYARLEDETVIQGESNITFLNREKGGKIDEVFLKPAYSKPLDEAKEDILNADVVLIGPGSLYTSIIPNLLVEDISNALKETKATIYYITNIMTQPGETTSYSVKDHVDAINKHANSKIIDKIVVNNKLVPRDMLFKYLYKDNTKPVYLVGDESDELEKEGYEIIQGDFLNIKNDFIRHDAKSIAKIILDDYISKI